MVPNKGYVLLIQDSDSYSNSSSNGSYFDTPCKLLLIHHHAVIGKNEEGSDITQDVPVRGLVEGRRTSYRTHELRRAVFHQLLALDKNTKAGSWGNKIKGWWRSGDINAMK